MESSGSHWKPVSTGVSIDPSTHPEGLLRVRARLPGRPGWRLEATYTRNGRLHRLVIEPCTLDDPDHVEIENANPPKTMNIPNEGYDPASSDRIDSAMLRAIALRDLENHLRWSVANPLPFDLSRKWERDLRAVQLAFGESPRPGRRGRDDLYYAIVADRYVSLLGASRRPAADLAVQMNTGRSNVNNLLAEARRRGLLTSAGPGRAGGMLTAKARRLLRERN